jgi:hypothetical protein
MFPQVIPKREDLSGEVFTFREASVSRLVLASGHDGGPAGAGLAGKGAGGVLSLFPGLVFLFSGVLVLVLAEGLAAGVRAAQR